MMRSSIIAFFIIFICINIHAQNIILEGIVYDAKFNIPIPDAEVYVENTHVGTTTNSVGKFYLSVHDSLSNHNLVAEANGYAPMRIPISIVYAPQIEIFLDADLRQNIAENGAMDRVQGFLDKALNFVMNDWVPLGNKENNKFDFGRLQTIPTINPIEGFRLRAGVASNSRFNPNLFVKGYVAYGFKDARFKYRGEAIYSFNKKEYYEGESLMNNVSLIYEDDIYSPGAMHPRAMNDLLLVTYKRSKNETTYRNFAEINYDREYLNGLRHTLWIRKSYFTPQGDLKFEKLNSESYSKDLNNTEIGVSVLWSGNNEYIQNMRRRSPVNTTAPLVLFSHSMGLDNFFGGDTYYHRSELSLQKRFEISDLATVDVVGEMVKVWNPVPFILLAYPNQRHKFDIENNAFFLSRSLEFVSDKQVTLRAVFIGNNLWLDKVGFFKSIGLKELVSFRASYGSLSDKNIPTKENGLFELPILTHTYKSGVPYIEGTVGITNIFGLFRLEYVHRFNYRNSPSAVLSALRLDIVI